jgi:hypothetical protein
VHKELESWNLGRHGQALPQDPVDLSWWVAASLPMEDSQRSLLLRDGQNHNRFPILGRPLSKENKFFVCIKAVAVQHHFCTTWPRAFFYLADVPVKSQGFEGV